MVPGGAKGLGSRSPKVVARLTGLQTLNMSNNPALHKDPRLKALKFNQKFDLLEWSWSCARPLGVVVGAVVPPPWRSRETPLGMSF